MVQLILTDDQAKALAAALKPMQVRDAQGNLLGTFTPVWTEADTAEAKSILASDESWSETKEVLSRLREREP
jgi:hypothetical protein